MTAPVVILPVVMRPNFADPAWREQHNREACALWQALQAPPPRTRPLLVVSNERFRVVRGEVIALDSRRLHPRAPDCFADDVQPGA